MHLPVCKIHKPLRYLAQTAGDQDSVVTAGEQSEVLQNLGRALCGCLRSRYSTGRHHCLLAGDIGCPQMEQNGRHIWVYIML